ncbi:MAG: M23 family metallopeptidase [Kiloniellales bacterium]|nr:M23 family metallopeptidase [Kiloniellales bacterium]
MPRAAAALWLWLAALTALAALAPAAAAQDLTLTGALSQGGLVYGQTRPGAEVRLDGRPVPVGEDGRFLFGFGRDAAPEAVLELTLPDGTQARRTLEIAQRAYDIQRVDGLPQEKVTPPEEVLARIAAERAMVKEVRQVFRPQAWFESGFIWPVEGPISGVYGSQRILNGEPRWPHYGVDVAAPEGTPIVAPADGLVVLAHDDMYYSGGTLMIDHGYGLTSAYLHLKEIWVEEGQMLRQGEPIASVGATGRVTGAHLDWRFNWFDERLDPELIVGPMPERP